VEEDSFGFMDWIYGSKDIPIEELPEKTSLQKNVKEFLKQGGKIGWTSGELNFFQNKFSFSSSLPHGTVIM